MRRLTAMLLAALLVFVASPLFAEDDEDEDDDPPSQTIDFDEELDLDGERSEAKLYRHETKHRADFDRVHETEKKSFLKGGDADDDGDRADGDEGDDD